MAVASLRGLPSVRVCLAASIVTLACLSSTGSFTTTHAAGASGSGPRPGLCGTQPRRGRIDVASPKIWQYERVASLLDGILRDVDAVSLAELSGLNPNEQNATAVDFLQTLLTVGVQVDQGAALKNKYAVQNFDANRVTTLQQAQSNSDYVKGLMDQRNALVANLADATDALNGLEKDKAAGTLTDGDQKIADATARVTTLSNQLTSVNGLIKDALPTTTVTGTPDVTTTSASAPTPALTGSAIGGIGGLIKQFPDLEKSLAGALASPSLPATEKLKNFITLLHERMSSEISVLQDDLMRDPNVVPYFLQFDVGLYPTDDANNRTAHVEFSLKCDACRVYTIYPAASAYNIGSYKGRSSDRTVKFDLGSLIGLGVNSQYERQHDQLQSSLVQSIYTAGYQSGRTTFGWYYGAAPFEQRVSPGLHTTYAIVSVPRDMVPDATSESRDLTFDVQKEWPKRDDDRDDQVGCEVARVAMPETDAAAAIPESVRAEPNRLHITRLEYSSVYGDPPSTPTTDTLSACPQMGCAGVLITLDQPIDPNLVVSVRGRALRRVRDWRGRATSDLSPAELGAGDGKTLHAPSPGLIELDGLAPDSWFAVNSHELLLNISRDLAGEEFPTVSITDPAKRTVQVPNDLRRDFTEVIVNGFRLIPYTPKKVWTYAARAFKGEKSFDTTLHVKAVRPNGTPGAAPRSDGAAHPDAPLSTGPFAFSTFLPLFVPDRPLKDFFVFYGETGEDVLIGMHQANVLATPWLAARTQVILEDRDLDFAWSLSCVPQGVYLSCALPRSEIAQTYQGFLDECSERCSGVQDRIDLVNAGFISGLQLWVEQFDPEGESAFGSHAPVALEPLGFATKLAVGEDFKPWGFKDYESLAVPNGQPVQAAPADRGPMITLRTCHSLDNVDQASLKMRQLGSDQAAEKTMVDAEGCTIFKLLAGAYQRSPVVLEVSGATKGSTRTDSAGRIVPVRGAGKTGSPATFRYTTTIPAELLRPALTNARAHFDKSSESWTIEWIAERTSCHMKTDLPTVLHPEWWNGNRLLMHDEVVPRLEAFVLQLPAADRATLQSIAAVDREALERWRTNLGPKVAPHNKLTDAQSAALDRLAAVDSSSPEFRAWQDDNPDQKKCDEWLSAQGAHTLRLRLRVERKTIEAIPSEPHFVDRGSDAFLAGLPPVTTALFPTKLTIEKISEKQFALRGPQAEMIDAVSVSNATIAKMFATVRGPEFAAFDLSVGSVVPVVTLSDADKKKGKALTDTALQPGNYVVKALFAIDLDPKHDIPIAAAGADGKPLTLLLPDADKPNTEPQDAPGTITTTTKTTTDKTIKTSKVPPKDPATNAPSPAGAKTATAPNTPATGTPATPPPASKGGGSGSSGSGSQ